MDFINIFFALQFFLSITKDGFHRRRYIANGSIFFVNGYNFRRILQQQLHPLLSLVYFFHLLFKENVAALEFFLSSLHFFRVLPQYLLLLLKFVAQLLSLG